MQRTHKQNKALYLLASFGMALFLCTDLARTVALELEASFTRYTGYSKAVYLGICGIAFMWIKGYQDKRSIPIMAAIIALLVSFYIACYLLPIQLDVLIAYNYPYLMRLLYLPLLLLVFISLSPKFTIKTLKVLEIIFWINAMVIVISLLLDIHMFRTYWPPRFGYTGLFGRNTTVTMICLILSFYYYYQWKYKCKNTLVQLLGVFVVCTLLGPKKTLAIPLIILGYDMLAYRKLYTKKVFWIAVVSSSTALIVFSSQIANILRVRFPHLAGVYDDKGWISTITSLRADLLDKMMTDFIPQFWSFGNYIFGGGYFRIVRTEMDVLDIYFLTGVVGLFAIAFIYGTYIFNYWKSHPLYTYFVVIFILYATFTSGMFFSADVALPVLLISLYFAHEARNNNEQSSQS